MKKIKDYAFANDLLGCSFDSVAIKQENGYKFFAYTNHYSCMFPNMDTWQEISLIFV